MHQGENADEYTFESNNAVAGSLRPTNVSYYGVGTEYPVGVRVEPAYPGIRVEPEQGLPPKSAVFYRNKVPVEFIAEDGVTYEIIFYELDRPEGGWIHDHNPDNPGTRTITPTSVGLFAHRGPESVDIRTEPVFPGTRTEDSIAPLSVFLFSDTVETHYDLLDDDYVAETKITWYRLTDGRGWVPDFGGHDNPPTIRTVVVAEGGMTDVGINSAKLNHLGQFGPASVGRTFDFTWSDGFVGPEDIPNANSIHVNSGTSFDYYGETYEYDAGYEGYLSPEGYIMFFRLNEGCIEASTDTDPLTRWTGVTGSLECEGVLPKSYRARRGVQRRNKTVRKHRQRGRRCKC